MKNIGEVFGESELKNEMQETNSCNYGGGPQNHQERDPYSKTVFQCPLKCEGDKTYDEAGKCPVCNMHLERVDEVHQHYYL